MLSSIRQRLLVTLLLIITVVGGISLTRSYLDARYEVQELFDAQLAQSARVVQAKALYGLRNLDSNIIQNIIDSQAHIPPLHKEQNADHHAAEITAYGHEYERKIAFQVWDDNNNMILHSAAAPTAPLSESSLKPQDSGFTDEVIDNTLWRVFSIWDNRNQYIIQIGERYDVRDELVNKISRRLVMSSLITLPVLALMIWFGVGRGLAPLLKVTHEIGRRDPDFLEPLELNPIPSEIRPVAEALNKLLLRLAEALEKERRFTDDAAHELRTPLAALKTQAQVALRADNESEQKQALQQVVNGVDRATHLLQQMLTLARLDPEKSQAQMQATNLYNACAEIIAQYATLAFEKNIELSLVGNEYISVMAEPTSFAMLVGNLLDNAIKYTPQGGMVTVNIVIRDNERASITVTDSGPGISPELQHRVFDRFYRIIGAQVSGSGLGLAIAQQSAKNLAATISLHNVAGESGLVVEVEFMHYSITNGNMRR